VLWSLLQQLWLLSLFQRRKRNKLDIKKSLIIQGLFLTCLLTFFLGKKVSKETLQHWFAPLFEKSGAKTLQPTFF
jgi:hypothetical protein